MPVPVDPFSFAPNTTIASSQVNARFAPLYAALNAALDASNLAAGRLDLSAAAGPLSAAGEGLGDKLALYGGSVNYGLGLQSNALVAYVPATAGLVVRATSASGDKSSGADAVRLGANGAITARGGRDVPTATEVGLRILRGRILGDGTVARGTGFTATRTGGGQFTISFATYFDTEPDVVVTPTGGAGRSACLADGPSLAWAQVLVSDAVGNLIDVPFEFIAIGPA